MFSDRQQMMLRHAVQTRDEHGNFACTDNPHLEAVIARLKAESPNKFHTSETLGQRVFYDQPRRGIPNAGFIVPTRNDHF